MIRLNKGKPAELYTPTNSSDKLGFIQSLKRLLRLSFKSYSNCKVSEDKWNKQYKSGHWDYLADIKELSHNSIIAGYAHRFSSNGNILDIGCGNGVLQQTLDKYGYNHYTGIDISSEAISIAQSFANKQTEFICSSASDFKSDKRYNVIIFNECLYYLEKPIETINMLKNYLEPDGKIIISMFGDDEPVVNCWKLVDELNSEVDSVMVTHKSGTYWIIKVLS